MVEGTIRLDVSFSKVMLGLHAPGPSPNKTSNAVSHVGSCEWSYGFHPVVIRMIESLLQDSAILLSPIIPCPGLKHPQGCFV